MNQFSHSSSPMCGSCKEHIIQLVSSAWCRCGAKVNPEKWEQFLHSNPHPDQFGVTRCLYKPKFRSPVGLKFDDATIDMPLHNCDDVVKIENHFETICHDKFGKIYLHNKLRRSKSLIVDLLASCDDDNPSNITVMFTFTSTHTLLMRELKLIADDNENKCIDTFIIHGANSRYDKRNDIIVNYCIPRSYIFNFRMTPNGITSVT